MKEKIGKQFDILWIPELSIINGMQKGLTDDGRQIVGKKSTFVWGRLFNTIIVYVVVVNITGSESHFLKKKAEPEFLIGLFLFNWSLASISNGKWTPPANCFFYSPFCFLNKRGSVWSISAAKILFFSSGGKNTFLLKYFFDFFGFFFCESQTLLTSQI